MKNLYVFLLSATLVSCADQDMPINDNAASVSGTLNQLAPDLVLGEPASGSSYAWDSDRRASNYDYSQYDDVEEGTILTNVLDQSSNWNSNTYSLAVADNSGRSKGIAPSETTSPVKTKTTETPKQTTETGAAPTQKSLKIIKDGTMTVQTENIDSSKFNIDKLVYQWGGYYHTEKLEHYDKRSVYTLVIRIPADHYEKVLAGIEKGGDKIEFKNITALDMTEEYNDVQTQLLNKKAYLNRYLELLSQAKNVKEILMIEDHIRPLQNDIERHIGRLRYLDDKVGFSTLNVMLYQLHEDEEEPIDENSFWHRLGKSFKSGWSIVVNFVLAIIAVWPQILVLLAVVLFIRSRRKRILEWFKK
jgi:hypothetical protein